MNSDPLKTIKDMNREISGLFDLAAKAARIDDKMALFQQIKDELEVYSLVEQRILYPSVATYDEITEVLDRVFDEHDEMNDIVDDIDQMETADGEFAEALKELKEVFSRHVEDEEENLLPEISRLLDDDQLSSIGSQINEVRGLSLAA